ncbi:MAG: excinuclease ABC subunit UvrC [Legionellaceae bacterium]|nr:excinuclease ABC subunit UvrC [Legionellaceae bacterium]
MSLPDKPENDPDWPAFLAELPNAPGVYQMLNAAGEILYVGKAKALKNRVSSYFQKRLQSPKTQSLMQQVRTIHISVTVSETEALLLENNLIKTLHPKYNILMRDDKSYPYIHIARQHAFPRIEVSRSKQKPKNSDFFGPYPSVQAMHDTLEWVHTLFKLRQCSDPFFKSRTRPCLQYQIQRCSAPCTAYIDAESYAQSVQQAIDFLRGKNTAVLAACSKEMDSLVANLEFEKAAVLRDRIRALRALQEQQGVVQAQGDADVISLLWEGSQVGVGHVMIRDGNVLMYRSFFPKVPLEILESQDEIERWESVFEAFIRHYYMDSADSIPSLIITDALGGRSGSIWAEMLTALRGKRCAIQTKVQTNKLLWLQFCRNNIQRAMQKQTQDETQMTLRFQALSKWLGRPIQRMECFDVSHTGGVSTIASCVVFNTQGPMKSAYRSFRIGGITPGDDYAALEQALLRRLKRLVLLEDLPELLVIDGGKGQVRVALQVLATLQIEGVSVVGIAKGPERKAGCERLIREDLVEQSLPPNSAAFHLLQQIRDEAHRFAIGAHRKSRQKQSLHSRLEDIPGVGALRRRALLKHFAGMQGLKKASVDELSKVPGISRSLAERIYESLE